ncbi:hypothetical protein PTT_07675 [Pyrenophora teres f. teres 0-1]|uniref:Uncharacterized protein n=1 Tax=Pyrenophora teres f. teres (strain 0-1) TaxID=861557 RepID=E3RI61_PYRTT|nr:hypothetical protein PTT_07675 [Pyrenophora teres f. teres 0-1]
MFDNASGKLLLEEYARDWRDILDLKCSALEVEAREFKPIISGDYYLTARFESLDQKEKIYGMGQYQQPYLDIKGTQLELAHRNSQASVPFACFFLRAQHLFLRLCVVYSSDGECK